MSKEFVSLEYEKQNTWAIKLLTVLTVILAAFCLVKIFIADVYTVEGGSMLPTYQSGEQVFARKVGGTNRFDTVIIKNAEDYMTLAGQGGRGTQRLFKRVVAVAGDEIWSEDGVLCLCFDGTTYRYYTENYGGGALAKMMWQIPRQKVPSGKIFVLGDNRTDSIDSRNFGFVDVKDVEAVVI